MALFGQASHDRTETSKRAIVLESELRVSLTQHRIL
jgi:hypothetical protein